MRIVQIENGKFYYLWVMFSPQELEDLTAIIKHEKFTSALNGVLGQGLGNFIIDHKLNFSPEFKLKFSLACNNSALFLNTLREKTPSAELGTKLFFQAWNLNLPTMVSLIHKHCAVDHLELIKMAHKHDTTSLLAFFFDRKIFAGNSFLSYLVDRREWGYLYDFIKSFEPSKVISLLRAEGHHHIVADLHFRGIFTTGDITDKVIV